jgi:hypothetical protein
VHRFSGDIDKAPVWKAPRFLRDGKTFLVLNGTDQHLYRGSIESHHVERLPGALANVKVSAWAFAPGDDAHPDVILTLEGKNFILRNLNNGEEMKQYIINSINPALCLWCGVIDFSAAANGRLVYRRRSRLPNRLYSFVIEGPSETVEVKLVRDAVQYDYLTSPSMTSYNISGFDIQGDHIVFSASGEARMAAEGITRYGHVGTPGVKLKEVLAEDTSITLADPVLGIDKLAGCVVANRINKEDQTFQGFHIWCEQELLDALHLKPNPKLIEIKEKVIPRQLLIPWHENGQRASPESALIIYEDDEQIPRIIKYIAAFQSNSRPISDSGPITWLTDDYVSYTEAQISPDGKRVAYVRPDKGVCVSSVQWSQGYPNRLMQESSCPIKGYQPHWDKDSSAFYVFNDQGEIVRIRVRPDGHTEASHPLGPRLFNVFGAWFGNNFAVVPGADGKTTEIFVNARTQIEDGFDFVPDWRSSLVVR